METLLTSSPEDAAEYIRRGELAAFPTETVYGLGADALDSNAVRRIYSVKGRPADNPMIVHLADRGQVSSVVRAMPQHAHTLVASFFPGPLTLVLEKSESIPGEVTAGLDTVGVRVPSHPVAHSFLTACGRPVAAPSANRSGRPSPTSWESVVDDLDGLIACILKGDRSTVGLESTVVDCTGPIPVVLRLGAISLESLRAEIPTIQPPSAAPQLERRSPGLRHRHYAPHARVRFYHARAHEDPRPKAYIGVTVAEHLEVFDLVLLCRDMDHYAHELFHFFRSCERAGIKVIYCERPAPTGIGTALTDRIQRAEQAGRNERDLR